MEIDAIAMQITTYVASTFVDIFSAGGSEGENSTRSTTSANECTSGTMRMEMRTDVLTALNATRNMRNAAIGTTEKNGDAVRIGATTTVCMSLDVEHKNEDALSFADTAETRNMLRVDATPARIFPRMPWEYIKARRITSTPILTTKSAHIRHTFSPNVSRTHERANNDARMNATAPVITNGNDTEFTSYV